MAKSLLNSLFGKKSQTEIAEEFSMDAKRRIEVWRSILPTISEVYELCKFFNYKNIDRALEDKAGLDSVLTRIEERISKELVSISKIERLDDEIVSDLKRITSHEHETFLNDIRTRVWTQKRKEQHLRDLFQNIHNILTLELETIRLIRKDPPNKKELLLLLFKLIFFRECDLFLIFTNREKGLEAETNAIRELAMKILLEEKIVEEIETDEEIFAKKMVEETEKMAEKMRPSDSESVNSYRRLGEHICDTLMEMAAKKVNGEGLPLLRKHDEIMMAVEEFDKLIDDEELLYRIVKQKRTKYDDAKIKQVVSAFYVAFHNGHFEELINFAD